MKTAISMSLNSIILFLFILMSTAFLTLLERKMLSLTGIRKGPNKMSMMGIFQPIGDATKLMNKQINLLSSFSYWFYYLSSSMMFFFTMLLWISLNNPFEMNIKLNFMFIMLILSFNSLKIIMAGWSTFSKFPLIGMIRTINQTISYESVLCLCVLVLIILPMSFNLQESKILNSWMMISLIPLVFLIWIPSILADLNRTPYDFSEGESELVSGYNTEFGSSGFTMIFLSEYSNIIFMSALTTMMFLNSNFNLMLSFFLLTNFFIIWTRSTLPRSRIDKLMKMAWKVFIPMVTIILMMFLMI